MLSELNQLIRCGPIIPRVHRIISRVKDLVNLVHGIDRDLHLHRSVHHLDRRSGITLVAA
jgi:hypothetical protein